MEKFQKALEAGEKRVDFFEYLFPRLFPSCRHSVIELQNVLI